MYQSTKKYDHNVGLSCCFRQWRADSHCHFLHGYALAFKFVFESENLDIRNWVVDFGSLKSLKKMLEDNFDHITIVAEDDPHFDWFVEANKRGIINMVSVPATGCEAVARMVYECADIWLGDAGYKPRVHLRSVEVSEHSGNSAIYEIENKVLY